MKIVQHPNEIGELAIGATIGNFDGVHLGHKNMLESVKQECKRRKLAFVVITFFPHPLQILKAMRGFLISSYQDRRKHLEALGVDYLVEIPFTKDFSSLSADEFIVQYIRSVKGFKLLCLGYDFAFGANKEGNANLVETALEGSDVEVKSLCEHKSSNEKISSTVIRDLVRNGKVDGVESLLGRKFSIVGKVVRGKGRGKGIGFPTANIQIEEEIITPSTGVYATKTRLNGVEYTSVTNIGFNPTFNDVLHMSIETYVNGISHDFYDQSIEVIFVKKIREEKRFTNIDALKLQIKQDVEKASEINGD